MPLLRFGRKVSTVAPAPAPASPPPFNLVEAAERLLENAKKLEAAGAADEEQLRRAVAMSAKTIASETMPVMDALRLEWLMMTEIAAWRLFMEWKAFDHIPVGGSVAISDLAKALDAQESLVGGYLPRRDVWVCVS
jgi:hypothetical protein